MPTQFLSWHLYAKQNSITYLFKWLKYVLSRYRGIMVCRYRGVIGVAVLGDTKGGTGPRLVILMFEYF
jgi:hypothetical protein